MKSSGFAVADDGSPMAGNATYSRLADSYSIMSDFYEDIPGPWSREGAKVIRFALAKP